MLDALRGRVNAQVARLVDDSTLSLERSGALDTVRTLAFEVDHRCEITVHSNDDTIQSVRFRTDTGDAYDIVFTLSADGVTTKTRSSEPAVLRKVEPGPLRVVYQLPAPDGTSRRCQTEWIQL